MRNTKKSTVDLPSTWDELTIQDWKNMLALREDVIKKIKKGGQLSIKDVRNEAARRLLLARGVRTRYTSDKYYLLVYKVGVTLDWLWKDYEDGTMELVYHSTVQLLPRYRKWNGPRSHGEDLTFGEFKQAVNIIQMYNDSHAPYLLAALCGLLYRPESSRKKTGLWRATTANETVTDWMKRGAQMPTWFQWGVYAWFAYFCEYLTTGDFIIDGQQVNFGCIFANGNDKKKQNDIGMNAIAFTMAETHIFGDLKDVEETQLLKVCLKLLNDYNKVKEMEAKK